MILKRRERSPWGAGNILFPDLHGGYMCAFASWKFNKMPTYDLCTCHLCLQPSPFSRPRYSFHIAHWQLKCKMSFSPSTLPATKASRHPHTHLSVHLPVQSPVRNQWGIFSNSFMIHRLYLITYQDLLVLFLDISQNYPLLYSNYHCLRSELYLLS